jgi:hypothetical protein
VVGDGDNGAYPGAPLRKKKDFELEAQLIVDGIATIDPYMVNVLQARKIYQVTGHAIYPWEVDDFPTDWIDAILAIAGAHPTKAN